MGHDISYNDLIILADKLAQAFYNIGIKDGDNVAILTISMPIVHILSKIHILFINSLDKLWFICII